MKTRVMTRLRRGQFFLEKKLLITVQKFFSRTIRKLLRLEIVKKTGKLDDDKNRKNIYSF